MPIYPLILDMGISADVLLSLKGYVRLRGVLEFSNTAASRRCRHPILAWRVMIGAPREVGSIGELLGEHERKSSANGNGGNYAEP